MAKSLESRLGERLPGFIEDVGKYGVIQTMDRYGVRDYVSARKLIDKQTGDPNYGLSPKIDRSPGRDLGTQLLEAFTNRVLAMQAQLKAKDEQIDYLKYQLHLEGLKNETKAIDVLEMLKSG